MTEKKQRTPSPTEIDERLGAGLTVSREKAVEARDEAFNHGYREGFEAAKSEMLTLIKNLKP